MMLLLETYAAALVAALLIGVVAAYWAFRRPGGVADEAPRPAAETARSPAVVETLEVPPLMGAPIPEMSVAPLPTELPHVETAADLPPTADGPPDDLQTLKGVGAKFAARLGELGITRFDQLARLTDADVAGLDEQMGAFRGRLARDRVVEQAGYLARGDRAGFEATFGNLGSGSPPAV